MIKLLSFALLLTGFFALLGITPSSLKAEFLLLIKHNRKEQTKKEPLRAFVTKLEGKKKENIFKRANKEAKSALVGIGQKDRFKQTQLLAFIFAICGFAVGVLASNAMLAVILSVGLYFLPLWFTRFSVYKYTRDVNEELSIALSLITTSYIRSNDFTAAVGENINHMEGAVQGAFKNYLNRIQINPSINFALLELQKEIDCPLFVSWTDTVLLCQDDYTIKFALPPIVRKLSVLKKLQMENETKMMMPLRYAFMLIGLTLFMFPFLNFINPQWLQALLHTFVGQLSICTATVACLLMLNKSIKLSGPIEFSL